MEALNQQATQSLARAMGEAPAGWNSLPKWIAARYDGRLIVTGAAWTVEQCIELAVELFDDIVTYVGAEPTDEICSFSRWDGSPITQETMTDAYWDVAGESYDTAEDAWAAFIEATTDEYIEVSAISHEEAFKAAQERI